MKLGILTILLFLTVSVSAAIYTDEEPPERDHSPAAIGFGVGIFLGFAAGYHCAKGEK